MPTPDQVKWIRQLAAFISDREIRVGIGVTQDDIDAVYEETPRPAPDLHQLILLLDMFGREADQAAEWAATIRSGLGGKAVDPEKVDALSKSIYDLDISQRSLSCLQYAGKQWLWQVAITPEAEMLKMKNFGRKCLNEMMEFLIEIGYGYGTRQTDPVIQAAMRKTGATPA